MADLIDSSSDSGTIVRFFISSTFGVIMNWSCSVANDGQMLPFSLDGDFGFSAPPAYDGALHPYGKVCAIGTTMVTGVAFCAQGVKTMFSGTDDEPFSLQRQRSFRACTYLYAGITAVAGAVFLAYSGST